MTTEQLTALWENVTVGQAVVVVAAVFLAARLAEIVVDGVRSLARRRTSADEQRDDVEQVEQLRERVDAYGSDQLQVLTSIDDAMTELPVETVTELRGIRGALDRLVDQLVDRPERDRLARMRAELLGQLPDGPARDHVRSLPGADRGDVAAQTGDGS